MRANYETYRKYFQVGMERYFRNQGTHTLDTMKDLYESATKQLSSVEMEHIDQLLKPIENDMCVR